MSLDELFDDEADAITALARRENEPGQVVLDRKDLTKEQASYNPMYVLVVSEVTAEEKEVAATGKTVAEHNPNYPPDDRVVRCAYESGLDAAYGDAWRKHIFRDLSEWVERTRDRTGAYPKVYDYPESRLVPAKLQVRIVPGPNPTPEDLETLERRMRRYLATLAEDADA